MKKDIFSQLVEEFPLSNKLDDPEHYEHVLGLYFA
jgi:hypothetical protein